MKSKQIEQPSFSGQLVLTQDGSHTIYMPEQDEHYHSRFGAIQESRHVYINAGYHSATDTTDQPLSVLEMGFGTGLNTFLTYLEARNEDRPIHYHAIELFPVPSTLIEAMNYTKHLTRSEAFIFQKIHMAQWDTKEEIAPDFFLTKIHSDLLSVTFDTKFHLVYFDAFAPDVQPVLWEEPVLQKIFDCMEKEAVFITYSAKGSIKRRLKSPPLSLPSSQSALPINSLTAKGF